MWKNTLIHMTIKWNVISDSVIGFRHFGNWTPNGISSVVWIVYCQTVEVRNHLFSSIFWNSTLSWLDFKVHCESVNVPWILSLASHIREFLDWVIDKIKQIYPESSTFQIMVINSAILKLWIHIFIFLFNLYFQYMFQVILYSSGRENWFIELYPHMPSSFLS